MNYVFHLMRNLWGLKTFVQNKVDSEWTLSRSYAVLHFTLLCPDMNHRWSYSLWTQRWHYDHMAHGVNTISLSDDHERLQGGHPSKIKITFLLKSFHLYKRAQSGLLKMMIYVYHFPLYAFLVLYEISHIQLFQHC